MSGATSDDLAAFLSPFLNFIRDVLAQAGQFVGGE
jgi:hypothetical protein